MACMNVLQKIMVCLSQQMIIRQWLQLEHSVHRLTIYFPNTAGQARKNGHLTVQFPPSFDHMPDVPIWSWNGQPVNLSCIAESIPNATIKWM